MREEQITEAVEALNESNAERIIDKYSDKIVSGFSQMIDAVVPVATEGFTIMVKYEFVKGLCLMLIPATFLVTLYLLRKEYKKLREDAKNLTQSQTKDRYYRNYTIFSEEIISAPFVMLGIVFLFSAVCIIPAICKGLPRLIVPEWYAINTIINLVQ